MTFKNIVIPADFRDRWFSREFGTVVQESIRSAPSELEIDFSQCEWIDPLPILALLCELKQWADNPLPSNKKLEINLGTSGAGGDKIAKKARARRYLAKHQFLLAFTEAYSEVTFHFNSEREDLPSTYPATELPSLLRLIDHTHVKGGELFYHADPACRPRFAPLVNSLEHAGETVRDFINEVVQSMDNALFRARLSQFIYRDSALQRLREIATEIVANAVEHAYQGLNSGPVCIYARLRHGDDRTVDTETKKQCPMIEPIQGVTATRYVELFVVDVGQGLSADAEEWIKSSSDPTTQQELRAMKMQMEKATRSPLLGVLQVLFKHPVSRHKRNQSAPDTMLRGNVTGLQHVNNVLSHHRDVSRLSVGSEWVAGSHPYSFAERSEFYEPVESLPGAAPSGTFFHFAIDIAADIGELGREWLAGSVPPSPDFQKLQEAFQSSGGKTKSVAVYDIRAQSEGLGHSEIQPDHTILSGASKYVQECKKLVVFRAPRNFPKGIHDRLIEQWVADILQNPRRSTLVFADLSHSQAMLLAAHIKLLKISVECDSPLDRQLLEICLVSEDLASCVLSVKIQRLARGEIGQIPYLDITFSKRDTPPNSKNLIPILESLRSLDSEHFWNYIDHLDRNLSNSLLKRGVVWARDEFGRVTAELPLYLNYSMATQHRELAKITRRALRRALAAFPHLHTIAIDDFVKADMADAQRWSPEYSEALGPHSNENIFVISALASGSTVDRAVKRFGEPKAVMCCFVVKSEPPVVLSRPTYAALEWRTEKFPRQVQGEHWERVPDTPFIQRFGKLVGTELADKPFLRPVARTMAKDPYDQRTPGAAYREWHRAGLMRIGHWQIDRRHGLIEIDHARSLQQSAESHSGFYNWLEDELIARAEGATSPLIVYPASRLGAIMIRHLLYKTQKFSKNTSKWQAIPLNYLPDIGGGLRQIEPLTLAELKETSACKGGIAFFLDIGFVGNRTFRQTRRQLISIGVGRVIGLGLLNRTSFPALISEMDGNEDVFGFWRVDVPTLNDDRSCPLCRGLVAIDALRERVSIYQPALKQIVERIAKNWSPADPNLSWWDHGLDPHPLNLQLKKKFGFQPPTTPTESREESSSKKQLDLVDQFGNVVNSPPRPTDSWIVNEDAWHHVLLEDSAQAATYAIEIARTTSNVSYPWRLASQLAKNDPLAAIEVACTYLLLCGPDLEVAVKEQGAVLLLEQLCLIEMPSFAESDLLKSDLRKIERIVRLRGLAVLTLANLDVETKKLMLPEVVKAMSKVRLVSPEIRLAMIAIVSVGQIYKGDGGAEFDRLKEAMVEDLRKVSSSESLKPTDILLWNTVLVNISNLQIADQFSNALEFFGAGEKHGTLRDVFSVADGIHVPKAGVGVVAWNLIGSTIDRALALTCEGVRDSQAQAKGDSLRFNALFNSLCAFDKNLWPEMLKLDRSVFTNDSGEADQKVRNLGEADQKARALLSKARAAFHGAFIRVGNAAKDEPLSIRVLKKIEEAIPSHLNNSDFWRFHSIDDVAKLTSGMRYVLWGKQLADFVHHVCKEASQWADETPHEPPAEFGKTLRGRARLWIRLQKTPNNRLELSFWNLGNEESDAGEFIDSRSDLVKIYQELGEAFEPELGPRFEREIVTDANNKAWSVSRIFLYGISGGQK